MFMIILFLAGIIGLPLSVHFHNYGWASWCAVCFVIWGGAKFGAFS